MGEVEEVQEQIKTDMEATKEQMATIMEAMMSMKKIMEADAVAIAATSTVVKYSAMKMVGYTPSSFADMAFIGKRIEVGLKRGKFGHPALIKTGANEEDENEGETHVVAAIPIWPSFPPTQQSTSRAYVQSSSNPLEIFHSLCKTHFTKSDHTGTTLPLCSRILYNKRPTNKHSERVPGEIYKDRIRVDPWVHALTFRGLHVLTFRGLHVLTFKGLHVLTFRGLHILTFRGLHVLIFRGLHVLTFRGLHILALRGLHVLTFRGLHVLAVRGLHVLTFKGLHTLTFKGLHVLAIRGLHSLTFRGLHVLTFRGLHALTFRGLHVLAFRGLRVLTFSGLHICAFREFKRLQCRSPPAEVSVGLCRPDIGIAPTKTPSGPEEVQQGPRVSSSDYGPLDRTRKTPNGPEEVQKVLELPALITGLCQFYGVPVAPSKVIRPPTNRAFIKKYCAPRQAQGETPQQPGDGWQRATDAPPLPLEFTSAHPQKG
ncbi:Dynein heavy chain [Glycine soja]